MNRVDVVTATTPRETAPPAAETDAPDAGPDKPQADVAAETKPARRRRASSTPNKPAQREKE